MRLLIQRVKKARVVAETQEVAAIDQGLVVLVGISKKDTQADVQKCSAKLKALRIFEDGSGKMNLDIGQCRGAVLSVPQFTLYADLAGGNRPGFDQAAGKDEAMRWWLLFNQLLRDSGIRVEEGVFGSHMQVELVNDGPVTIWLDSVCFDCA